MFEQEDRSVKKKEKLLKVIFLVRTVVYILSFCCETVVTAGIPFLLIVCRHHTSHHKYMALYDQ